LEEFLTPIRKKSRTTSILKVSTDLIETNFALTPSEVAGLWASITNTIHPDYFNSVAWYKHGSKTNRTIHDHLRQASILLVAKFVDQVTTGPPNSRYINAITRYKYLSDMTSCTLSNPQWPLPAPDMPISSDRTGWENRPLHYFPGYTSSGYFSVVVKLRPPSPTLELQDATNHRGTSDAVQPDSMTNSRSSPCDEDPLQPLPESPSIPNSHKRSPKVASEDVDPPQCQESPVNFGMGSSTAVHLDSEADNETVDQTSGRCNITEGVSFAEDDPCYNSDSDNSPISPSADVIENPFARNKNSRGRAYYQDPETGQYFPKPVVDYNRNIGPSTDLEISEEFLITDKMLERARGICEGEADADLAAVAAVAEFEMGWEDITRRAIRQAFLSALGQAGLLLEYLAKYSMKINEHIIYWKRREAMIDALTKKLQEEQTRVAEDAAILAKAKSTVIAKSHQLAKEQQKVYATNQRNIPPASIATAVSRPDQPSRGIERLRKKLHDSKNRSNPANGRPNTSGFSGVRPISESAISLSSTYASSIVSGLPQETTQSQPTMSARFYGESEGSPPPTVASPGIPSTSPRTPDSVLGSDGSHKLREHFEL
jgi:hypothetical protein